MFELMDAGFRSLQKEDVLISSVTLAVSQET